MQNLVSTQYTDEEIAQTDAALNAPGELTKLGPKSQAFRRWPPGRRALA